MCLPLRQFQRLTLASAAMLAFPMHSEAVNLAIANPSFETPIYGDGVFDFFVAPSEQGPYGWTVTNGAAIYNPLESDYGLANANGTPRGGSGAQVGFIYGAADFPIFQRLAGPDAIVGSSDDPVVAPGTDYTLTVSIGQRFTGNLLTSYGGYDIQLIAGTGAAARIIGRETNAVTPPPGSFVTRTIAVDCLQTLDPAIAGQPLTIYLRKTSSAETATTDFDNVSLDAVKISPLANADFNELGGVNAADLALWRAGFQGLCHDATHLDGNADTDGDVDGNDFLAWQRQLASMPTSGVPSIGPMQTPEPSSGLLVATLLGCIGARRMGELFTRRARRGPPSLPAGQRRPHRLRRRRRGRIRPLFRSGNDRSR